VAAILEQTQGRQERDPPSSLLLLLLLLLMGKKKRSVVTAAFVPAPRTFHPTLDMRLSRAHLFASHWRGCEMADG